MTRDLEQALAHVRWIGGSACAGKTSVAARLAADHGLRLYSCDERFEAHREGADPGRHRRFLELAGRGPGELFQPPARQRAAELEGFYEEELELVVEDLLALDAGPALAEGAGLLPASLAAIGVAPGRALWLVATPDFRRRCCRRRRERMDALLRRCPDPEQARRVWMERDDRFADAVSAAARRTGGRVLRVDGRHGLEQTAAAAARHFRLPREPS